MIKNGNILILTQWSFKDALIQTYTLPYVDIIRKIITKDSEIFLVTSEQKDIALTKSDITSVNNEWKTKKMKLLTLPYQRFGIKKILFFFGHFFQMFFLIKKKKIKIIHAFGTPAGGIAYLLSALSGTKLVIDSYEPHAESMVENGTWKRSSIAFKLLFALEKRQTRSAFGLIGTTEGMRNYALEKYGFRIDNFFIKPACVDLDTFFPTKKNATLLKEFNLENKIVCVYAGKLGGIYFKEEVFDFVKSCYNYWKNDFSFLILTNSPAEEVKIEIERVGLPADIVISQFVFHREVSKYLSLGDFAINPVRPVPTKRFCTSIKDGEYWAMGLPVIISPSISDDSDIIEQNEIGIVFDLQQKENYDKTVSSIDHLIKNNSREDLQNKIFSVAEKYRSFEIAKRIYPLIYGSE